ncbi:MAG: hypothetical protein Q8L42_05585, partial [Sulfurimicrobium sp.]|nr:hypothetical protein [Sulfurimicrobium sp.]
MKNAHQLHSLIAGVVLAMSVASSSILAADMPSEKDVAKEKVIFQVSAGDPKTWNLALNNAKNVQQELGAKNV